MVSANLEGLAEEVLAEFLDECDDGEEFFPCNVVILFMFVVELTRKTEGSFLTILHLGEDGSNGVATGVAIEDQLSLVVGQC